MAADENGNKELLAVSDGFRESKTSWKEILLDLKGRGLEMGPKLAVGDGALGFWAALDEVFPKIRRQRCWVHKTANILDKLPKSMHSKAKSMIHEMYMAVTKADALKAFDHFVESYESKGSGSRTATLTMIYKRSLEAEKTWKKLKGYKLIKLVLEQKRFVDGELQEKAA